MAPKKRKIKEDSSSVCMNPKCLQLLKKGHEALKKLQQRYTALVAGVSGLVDMILEMDPEGPDFDPSSFSDIIEFAKKMKAKQNENKSNA